MIFREKIFVNQLITKNMKLKDCELFDCKIEEGALLQNCKIVIDGEIVSPDCECLKVAEVDSLTELEEEILEELEEELFNESFEEGGENAD